MNDPKLNPHLFLKVQQVERNFKRALWGKSGGYLGPGYNRRRGSYWARYYMKWVKLLVERKS